MEMVIRNFIIFGLVQMATANEHYRHTNRKDPGRNFKLSLITLKQYDFYKICSDHKKVYSKQFNSFIRI